MTTIPQRLRSLANVLQDGGLEMNASKLLEIAAELEAQPAGDEAIEALIEDSDGAWHEDQFRIDSADLMRLLRRATALSSQCNTEKPLDDPRLQELFGCAIDGALTIGYQGGAAASNGHWLKPWWEKGRAVAEREAALQAEIAQLQQSRDTYFAERNSARDAYMKHRKIGDELQERINALEAQLTCHDGMAAIEHALEELVDRCNNDAFLSTDESVIRAEAALERIYIARRLASSSPQQDSSKE